MSEIIGDFLVRLGIVKNKEIIENISEENFSTLFGVENEEDNILLFYYAVIDITKGIINGTLQLKRLPKYPFQFPDNINISETDELLSKYLNYLKTELKEYENFKKGLKKNE